jgi:anti-sigma regulatory factor (Ser/Thr protein kinase)
MSEISTLIPALAEAPAMARRVLSEFVAEAIPHELLEDAALLTSEVVTNSVRHAGLSTDEEIGMELVLSDDYLRVSVTDAGRLRTRSRRPCCGTGHGRLGPGPRGSGV